ncbi:MAG: tetratricopeptide repeat protein, partial [Candidatus Binatia bacterium]
STTPFLVVVEDVHWAEGVALQCLAAMSRATCGRSRAVVLMTSRVEGDPLSDLRPMWSGLSLVLIELGRLGDEEARALAKGILGDGNPLLDECIARAEGNPLFLEQLVRHASAGGRRAELPGSIRSVVTAQIDRLDAADKTALYAAAVLGQQFSVESIRAMLGSSEWSPESLVANRILVPGEDFLHFAHALIRESVYASMLRAERRRLHLAAADWFVSREKALRAEHLAKAESPEAVATYLAAVEEQVAKYRVDDALALLARAEAVAAESADRCAVNLRQGDLLTEAGRPTEALAAYERALAVAPDDEAVALSKLGTAGVLRLLDRNDEALAFLEEAEPAFAAKGRVAELARLEHLRGNLLFPLGRVEACEAAHRRAFDYAKRSGSIELEARALGGLGDSAFASGRFVTSHRRIVECVELARQHGFGRIEIANAFGLGAFSGDAVRGLAVVDDAIAMAVDARQLRAELTGHHAAMTLCLWAGREESVKGHFARAQVLVEQIGAQRFRGLNLALMGEAHRRLGDRSRAAAMQREA